MNNERLNKIKKNKNLFITDTDAYKRKYSKDIDMINDYLEEYGFSKEELLVNPACIYTKKVIALDKELSAKGVEYFASEFGLRELYERKLISFSDSSVFGIDKLITKLNRINKLLLSSRGIYLRNALVNTGLAKLYVSQEVEAINKITKGMDNYKLEGNLEELMTKKYTDEEYVKRFKNIFLAFAFDCNTLRKIGLGTELETFEEDLKYKIIEHTLKEKVKTK